MLAVLGPLKGTTALISGHLLGIYSQWLAAGPGGTELPGKNPEGYGVGKASHGTRTEKTHPNPTVTACGIW